MMKKILKYLPALTFMAFLGAACSADEIEKYHNDTNNVYFDFEKEKERPKLVNLNYSFYDTPLAAEYLFEIPVRISGPRVDYDRTFGVLPADAPASLPAGTLYAQDGVNYRLETTGVIPAGEGSGVVKLTLLNTTLPIGVAQYYLKLDLVATGDMSVSFSGGSPTMNSAEVRFSSLLVKPYWWNEAVSGNFAYQLKIWQRTANELFRVATGGVKELELLADNSVSVASNAIIKQFTDMIKDPDAWLAMPVNAGKATIAAAGTDGEGYDVYTFTVTSLGSTGTGVPEGTVYRYRNNTALGIKQWVGDDNGYSIFY